MATESDTERAARRELIVQRGLAAVEALLEGGESFTELSVERIATEAGLSRSTFYVYFDDKGHLLSALSVELGRHIAAAATAWSALPPDASRDDVRAAVREIVVTYRAHGLLMGAVVEASAYDPRIRAAFGAMLDRVVASVAAHVRAGQAARTVRAELDPDGTAGWLTWMTERGLYNLVRHADAARAERYSEALTTIVWNTLRHPG